MSVPAHSQSNNSNDGGGQQGSGDAAGDGKGEGGDSNQNQGNNQANNQNQDAGNIDLKSLSSDQLAAVFENPALWDHPRFKNLSERAQKAKQLEDEKAQQEEKSLEEQKKFQELADKRATDLEKANETIKNMQISQALTNKLVPEGVVDVEAAIQLVDRSKIEIDDNGNVSGVEDAIEALKTNKTYLFKEGDNNSNTSLGSSSNNNQGDSGGGTMKFKRSQLQDPVFYKENREEIIKAAKAGLIENDLQ